MTHRSIVLAAVFALASVGGIAHSQGKQTFAKTQKFRSCQKTWAFACGMVDAAGRRFGTAHEVQHCSLYTFHPNGSLELQDYPGPHQRGHYEIRGGHVYIELVDSRGKVINQFDLPLSKDRKTMGDMKRVNPEAAPSR